VDEFRAGHFRAEIYPFGFKLREHVKVKSARSAGAKRGSIRDFSHEAARRLRETFMTRFVEDAALWAFTLTTHRICTPVEWREIMKRFRVAVKRSRWAGLWRVELQRRKAPHAHVAFWLPSGVGHEEVEALWLKCTGEAEDAAAVEHAVRSRKIPHDASGWAYYMGLHDGKSKEAQLGWVGKQWGIWNREILDTREPVVYTLAPRAHVALLRVLRKLEWARRCRKVVSRGVSMLAQIPVVLRGSLQLRASKPPKVRPLHRGNLLRCMNGELVTRIMAGLVDGTIYP
jgi:hypothetical protein